MRRRRFLTGVTAGVTVGSVGCIGGGSKVVTNLQREVGVMPGSGWVERIPDVSDHGGAIQYVARADAPFDVYFFTTEQAFLYYDEYVDGDDPPATPAGDEAIGATASERGSGEYVAATQDGGAREKITETGPYFFVVDHSDYRGTTPPGEEATELSVFVDLTVTAKRFL